MPFHFIQIMLYRSIKSDDLNGEDNFIIILLDPYQLISIVPTWNIVLLKKVISNGKDKYHARMQLLYSNIEIVSNFHGLVRHNQDSRRR